MPFFDNRPHLDIRGSCRIFLNELVTVEKKTKDGVVSVTSLKPVDQCKELPKLEEYTLEAQLAAGVPLKTVGSKMMEASTLFIDSSTLESEKNGNVDNDKQPNPSNDKG